MGERPLSNSGTGGSQRLFLGGEADGLPFLGYLDEVRIWLQVRTEAQIRNGLYRELRSAPGLAAVFPEGGVEIPDATPVSGDPAIPRYRTIEIYDNNFPEQRRFIGIDWELNEFCYDRANIEAVEASPGVPAVVARVRPDCTGKPIYTLPLSIWRNSRTRPRIIEDGLEILYAIATGDTNVEHEDAIGRSFRLDARQERENRWRQCPSQQHHSKQRKGNLFPLGRVSRSPPTVGPLILAETTPLENDLSLI